MTSAELLSEVCQRCDDVGFRDFDKGRYTNALFRANRLVARKYHLMQKLLYFVLSTKTQEYDKDVLLDLPDMKEPIMVNVNGVNLRKKDYQIIDDKDMYCYYLFRQTDGTYLFNYSLGLTLENQIFVQNSDIPETYNQGLTDRVDEDNAFGKSANDEISILYEALQERDYDESEYVIPTNYEEEQIDFAIHHMAKLGIAKFNNGTDKLAKWSRLFNMTKKVQSFDPEVVESKEPTRIQIFQYP